VPLVSAAFVQLDLHQRRLHAHRAFSS